MNKVTLLGIGNILLRDEGFGVHFVRWFSGRYRFPEGLRVVDGGTLGYALLDVICGCEKLIVVDVIKSEDRPGSVYRFTKEELETRMPPPTSAHEVSFQDVLFKAELMEESPETVFLCIVPEDIRYGELGLDLTPRLRERFGAMEELLTNELTASGMVLERKQCTN